MIYEGIGNESVCKVGGFGLKDREDFEFNPYFPRPFTDISNATASSSIYILEETSEICTLETGSLEPRRALYHAQCSLSSHG